MTTLTLLHPGAMGAAIATQASRNGVRVLWLPTGRSEATRARAERAGLEACPSLAQALEASDAVLSVCPPQYAEDVAKQVATHHYRGLFVDANAISPQRMNRISTLMGEREIAVLDGAIFGPPPAAGKTARIHLAGESPESQLLEQVFKDTDIDVHVTEGPIGSASALKMAFAAFQKAARTLAGVSYALADAHGVADLLASEAKVMASDILSNPGYLPSVAARAWRWAPEMAEVAEAMRGAGLPTELAEATATVMQRWEADKDQADLPLAEVLHHLKQH